MTLIINRLQQVSSKVIGRDTTYITTSEANMILIKALQCRQKGEFGVS